MAISNTNPVQTPSLLAFITISLMLLMKGVDSSDSLSFNFSSFEPNSQDLIFQGDATVVPATRKIRLTNLDSSGTPLIDRVGRVLYYSPIHLWGTDPSRLSSFETSFTFVITHHPTPAAGIAFFIAPPDTTPGVSGGVMGLFDNTSIAQDPSRNQIVFVEFDTYVNGAWDPNYHHIGINVNQIRSSADTPWETISGAVVNVTISYDGESKKLSVSSFYPSTHQGPYTVSLDVDLAQVRLPEWVRIGISGTNGANRANYEILSWSFKSTLKSNAVNKDKEKENMRIAQYV